MSGRTRQLQQYSAVRQSSSPLQKAARGAGGGGRRGQVGVGAKGAQAGLRRGHGWPGQSFKLARVESGCWVCCRRENKRSKIVCRVLSFIYRISATFRSRYSWNCFGGRVAVAAALHPTLSPLLLLILHRPLHPTHPTHPFLTIQNDNKHHCIGT